MTASKHIQTNKLLLYLHLYFNVQHFLTIRKHKHIDAHTHTHRTFQIVSILKCISIRFDCFFSSSSSHSVCCVLIHFILSACIPFFVSWILFSSNRFKIWTYQKHIHCQINEANFSKITDYRMQLWIERQSAQYFFVTSFFPLFLVLFLFAYRKVFRWLHRIFWLVWSPDFLWQNWEMMFLGLKQLSTNFDQRLKWCVWQRNSNKNLDIKNFLIIQEIYNCGVLSLGWLTFMETTMEIMKILLDLTFISGWLSRCERQTE